MTFSETAIELLKLAAPIAVSYIGLLKTRTDLDRYIASRRAKEMERPVTQVLRKRWYHRFYRKRSPKRS